MRAIVLTPLALLLIAFAEIQIALGQPIVGVSLHAVTLLILMLIAGRADLPFARMLTALIPLPLLRVLGFAVPLPRAAPVFTYLLITLAMLVAVLLSSWRLRLTPAALGLRLRMSVLNWFTQSVVAISGAAIAFAAVRILHIAPPKTGLEGSSSALAMFALTAGALVESLLYRGLIQVTALRSLGRFGLLMALFAYISMSLGAPTLPLLFLNALLGLWWMLCSWRTRTLWGAMAGQIAFVVVFYFLLHA